MNNDWGLPRIKGEIAVLPVFQSDIRDEMDNLLAEIDQYMLEHTKTSNTLIAESVQNLIQAGGKRIRPLLANLTAKFGEYDREKMIKIGAGLELLHMATLVHDDIIDESAIRRGEETVQKKYGQDRAVFVGDFLYSSSYEIFTRVLSRSSLSRLSHVVKFICQGEVSQYQNRFNYDLNLRDYLRRIRRKTALFFSLSTYLGARESSLNRGLNNFYKLGLEMGMAFQIQDDILDFSGSEEILGKKICQDIYSGIYTLPLIYLLQSEEYSRPLISILSRDNFSSSDITDILALVKDAGSLEKSRQLGQRFIDRAENQLAKINSLYSGTEIIQVFKKIIKYQIERHQ